VVAETIETQYSPGNDGTMQRLRQQLKKAHNTIAQMRVEERTMIKKISKILTYMRKPLKTKENGKEILASAQENQTPLSTEQTPKGRKQSH
jgi:TolA-binding protein